MKKILLFNICLTVVAALFLICSPSAKGAFACPGPPINIFEGNVPCPGFADHYYQFNNGLPYHMECPSGLVFDPIFGYCTFP